MSVSGIEATGFTPYVAPAVQTPAVNKPSDAGGTDFGSLVVDGLDRMEQVSDKAADLSVRAATGDLGAIHDYTIAATEAQVTTQLTVALRNKAVEAFNEIMRMQV